MHYQNKHHVLKYVISFYYNYTAQRHEQRSCWHGAIEEPKYISKLLWLQSACKTYYGLWTRCIRKQIVKW